MSTRATGAATGLLAALVFLVALNLRPAITGLGPLLPFLSTDLRLPESAQGILGALPLLAFAAFSPLVPAAARRFGPERTVFAALIVLIAGLLLRSQFDAAGLWTGTIVIGAAIAVGNVLVPTLVKRDYPAHTGGAMGVSSAIMTLGAALAAALAVPFAGLFGWRGSLAIWAVPAALVALVWLARLRGGASVTETATHAAPGVSVWRQGTGWLVTAIMGLQSTGFYILVTWLPSIELAAGYRSVDAGLHLFVLQVSGVIGGLSIPLLLRNPQSQVLAGVTGSGVTLLGVIGMLVAPSAAVIWVVLLGAGTGSTLVFALTLITLRGRTPDETTQLSGMAQSVGYLLAAVGPVVVGVLAEASGGWTVPLLYTAANCALLLVLSIPAGRPRREARVS